MSEINSDSLNRDLIARLQKEKEQLKELITELVDALERSDPIQVSIQEVAALIERAREATE